MKNKKIGIFDSGIGGLSILKELLRILPNEDYLFYEDSINNPYGEKEAEELFDITSKIVDYLLGNDCKLIVIACNTATISCIKKLEKKYPNVVFVGVVPAIKIASDLNMKKTLLLATNYTIKSEYVKTLISNYNHTDQQFFLESGRDLASLIELGDINKIRELLIDILLLYKNIDSIVLGCTHYSLVSRTIQEILPNVKILDGSIDVAEEVKRKLEEKKLLSDSNGSIKIINSKSSKLVDKSFEILKNMIK